MRRRDFERVIVRALEELPPEFQRALENIDIQVRWRPTLGELRRGRVRHGGDLFGLYVGVPRTKRGHHYSLVLPDTIYIYQRAHERYCRTEDEMVEQARKTLLHEIGHYMGIDEDRLRQLGVG
jgi:predicted Zn-dependent protease with MMP-like domain